MLNQGNVPIEDIMPAKRGSGGDVCDGTPTPDPVSFGDFGASGKPKDLNMKDDNKPTDYPSVDGRMSAEALRNYAGVGDAHAIDAIVGHEKEVLLPAYKDGFQSPANAEMPK